MKRNLYSLLLLSILSVSFLYGVTPGNKHISGSGKAPDKANEISKPLQDSRPNIIFILTDDLGYGDVGVFFQNLRRKNNDRTEPWFPTPNLDKMASEGAVLTNHYNAAPVCAPSRGSLLSGLSQGHCNVRDNQFDKALDDNYTLGNVLQIAGYTTAAIGKWGLQGDSKWDKNGSQWPAHPLNRGFNYYYGYMRHGDGHEHYPADGVYEGKKQVYENRTEVSNGLDKCYTGDLFTSIAKKWISQEVRQNERKPFFLYLSYDTPHAVLELPTGAYPHGGGLKGGLQWLGQPGKMINTATGLPDSFISPKFRSATYDHDRNPATAEIPWPETYKRYATIVERIDQQVGDILKLLKDLKIDKNTLVVFGSDNGPSIESYLPKKYVNYSPEFFNSFAEFDGIKRDVLEGGLRTPTIVRWPAKIRKGKVISAPSVSYDWLPTFSEIAGLTPPEKTDGQSLLKPLLGADAGPDSAHEIYVEYFEGGKTPGFKEFEPDHRGRKRGQMQMIRFGNYVGLRYDIKSQPDDFEIYDIVNDPAESRNLASERKDLQLRMKESVIQRRLPDASAPRPYDNEPIAALHGPLPDRGITCRFYELSTPWLPKTESLQALSEVKLTSIATNTVPVQPGKGLYEFRGFLNVPSDGRYQIRVISSGKAFLRIHQIAAIDNDFKMAPLAEKSVSLPLKAGLHPFKLEVQYQPKDFKLNLEWRKTDSDNWTDLVFY